MRTVRRLYFYALALIGAEAVVWGAVALLRTIFSSGLVGGAGQLATGLSAVLVGLPVFLFHWLTCQRDARQDEEERTSRIRAIFLYAVRAAFLVPAIYSILALIDRNLAYWLCNLNVVATFGGSQNNVDNLVAILITQIAFWFFTSVLNAGERTQGPDSFLPETKRLYRYLWMAFGLTLVVTGTQFLLRYLLYLPTELHDPSPSLLSTGLALLLVGAPLWAWTWQLIEGIIDRPAERQSILRLVVLYLITLAGVVGVLAAGGNLLSGLLGWLFGRPQTFSGFLTESGGYIAAGIPLGVVWAYYGRILERETASQPGQPRREAVGRMYRSILAALGIAIVFAGVFSLAELVIDLLLVNSGVGGDWSRISSGLAAVGVGLPLWLAYWPGLQIEAAAHTDAGDRARRSVIRRTYLYLAVFALVVGGMIAAGSLFYSLLSTILGENSGDLLRIALQRIAALGEIAAFLVYHLQALRQDGRVQEQSLGNLHADYPVLVLVEQDPALAEGIAAELSRQAERLPLKIHSLERGMPDDSCLTAKMIVLTAGLAAEPSEALRLWLAGCSAKRLVLPLPHPGWTWLGVQPRSGQELARETATAIRQMAEGEAPRAGLPSSPWSIAGFVLGAIFAFSLLASLFSLIVGSLSR